MSLAKWGFTSSKDKKRKAESVSDKSNKAIKTAPKPSNDIPSEGSSAADDSEASKTTPKTSDDDSVERFLSHMESEDWKKALEPATKTASFKRLVKFVEGERAKKTVYPPPSEMFSAFNLTPFQSCSVVILGQDPYHGPNQGHGLSFSVKPSVPVPPSLRNIYKELLNTKAISAKPTHGYLESWARQGVFCLNVTLTVVRGSANSHETSKSSKGEGWLPFTSAAVRALSLKRDNLVFFGWGRNAADLIDRCVDKKRHLVIKSSHPSPLGATKTKAPFLGSDCFNKANEYLKEHGKETINWNSVNDL
ncbi:hypothetical protein TrRE_jg8607 [Triparma retinervis]|uniref:Uracil-DNA glycosylase n=1 Tax=Triparma retinervis TaxID=2557542 RepID=A0A9W7FF43_9STRA|nr:hypothetical protein TrRE_jg8607 [Triparma retinervis]